MGPEACLTSEGAAGGQGRAMAAKAVPSHIGCAKTSSLTHWGEGTPSHVV